VYQQQKLVRDKRMVTYSELGGYEEGAFEVLSVLQEPAIIFTLKIEAAGSW
jgi:hypothetical protein